MIGLDPVEIGPPCREVELPGGRRVLGRTSHPDRGEQVRGAEVVIDLGSRVSSATDDGVDGASVAIMVMGDRWGVSDAETRQHYGCDDFVTSPTLEAWRGVTVHATPEAVWARVRQVRIAPYSYDLVDNLGRRSPRELRDVPEPVVGDPFTRAFGRDQGRVVAVEPGRQLTARITGAHMSYVVEPAGEQTRLLLKVVTGIHPWLAPVVSLGDLPMARKQLLNLKALTESDRQD